MKLNIKISMIKKSDLEILDASAVAELKEAFADGWIAESLDFITSTYVELDDLYDPIQEIVEDPTFWGGDLATVRALTTKLFYRLIPKLSTLDVNEDLDASVTYWVEQATPIISKVLADRSEVNS